MEEGRERQGGGECGHEEIIYRNQSIKKPNETNVKKITKNKRKNKSILNEEKKGEHVLRDSW
jgi:hypothetical protein